MEMQKSLSNQLEFNSKSGDLTGSVKRLGRVHELGGLPTGMEDSSDEENEPSISMKKILLRIPFKKRPYNHDDDRKQPSLPQPINNDKFSPQSEAAIREESEMVSFGPNKTRIPANVYKTINWNSASKATRKLLTTIFERNVLATHSMTGKPSPAFPDKEVKNQLDTHKVDDIIYVVSRLCNVPRRSVRIAITTKCADENKMMRLRQAKSKMKAANVE